ncbi:MAG: VanZ family protein, partial [Gammaproteobacteria bacterium]|nr:VanZ family protein [Gammaproteobacteria bacterium]
TRTDLTTNFLVYIPLGLLAYIWLRSHYHWKVAGIIVLLTSLALSFTLESLQLFIPSRVPSFVDLVMNILGAAVGIAIAHTFSEHTNLGQRFQFLRHRWIKPGHLANMGLVILGLWAISELSPIIPSLEAAHIKKQLIPLSLVLEQPELLKPKLFFIAVLQLSALLYLATTVFKDSSRAIRSFFWFCVLIYLYKLTVVNRLLLPESILAVPIAISLVHITKNFSKQAIVFAIYFCIIVAYSLGQLGTLSSQAGYFREMNWIPFYSYIASVRQFTEIATTSWEFLLLAYAFIYLQARNSLLVMMLGLFGIAAFTLTLEVGQQYIVGAKPDITNVLLATLAWLLPWLHPLIRRRHSLNSL